MRSKALNRKATFRKSLKKMKTIKGGSLQKDHGYNFEVIPSETVQLNKAVPLKDMGRFRHEAVAIDPKTSIAYQTEDRDDGLVYRFVPKKKQEYIKKLYKITLRTFYLDYQKKLLSI